MSKLLQVSNATAQTVAANSFVNLGAITRRCDCNSNCPTFSYNGSTLITLNTAGYYEIGITTDITSTAATQQLALSIIQDGVSVGDLSAYATVAGEVSTKTRTFIVRVFCNNNTSLALQNASAADAIISNLNVSIIKVA